MTEGFRGEPLPNDEGHLRVEGSWPGAVVPIWPSGYELDAGGAELRVLDRNVRVAARVGEEVYMSGAKALQGPVFYQTLRAFRLR